MRGKLQFWEEARLSFGMPENIGLTRKTSPHSQSGGNPLPTVADCRINRYSKMTNQNVHSNMNNQKNIKPRGRPQVGSLRRLSKSVTVKFSKIDYDRLCHRSKQANRSLAEFLRESAFNAQIVAKHSTEETTVMRNLVGMANNLNQLTKLSHQTGFHRTQNMVVELLLKLKEIMWQYKSSERRQP